MVIYKNWTETHVQQKYKKKHNDSLGFFPIVRKKNLPTVQLRQRQQQSPFRKVTKHEKDCQSFVKCRRNNVGILTVINHQAFRIMIRARHFMAW